MAAASNFKSLLTGFRDDIRALVLDDLEDRRVYIRKTPTARGLEFPCVIVFPQPEKVRPWNNAMIDVGYGIGLVCAQVSNEQLEIDDNAERMLRWRMRLIRRYSEHGPEAVTGITGFHQSVVEPGNPLVTPAFMKNFDVSALLVRCWVIEPDTQP